jgi:hypothetical protein
MVDVVAGDVVELSIQGDFDATEDVFNVYHFQATNSGTVSEETWADEIKEIVDAILTLQKVLANTLTVWRRVRARFINKSDAGRLIELDAPVAGTDAGDPCPAGVAILSVFRTPLPRVVLKKYTGCVAEPAIGTNGQIVPATLTQAAAYISLLLAPITTTLNEYTFGHYDATTDTFTAPTSGYVNVEPAYQRRRRRGHGS